MKKIKYCSNAPLLRLWCRTLRANTPLYLRGMLEEVVDRHTLGHIRPLRSMGHHKNLFDRTRTVARVKALSTDI